MSSAQIRRRRERLFARDPHCFWCGTELVLPDPARAGGRLAKNTATLDHLRSRLTPTRGEPTHGRAATVLSCLSCNFERGRNEEAALPIEEQWRRSGRKPLAKREPELPSASSKE